MLIVKIIALFVFTANIGFAIKNKNTSAAYGWSSAFILVIINL